MSDLSDFALEDEDDARIEGAANAINDHESETEDDGSTGVIEADPDPMEQLAR